jgi:hypothetical protein
MAWPHMWSPLAAVPMTIGAVLGAYSAYRGFCQIVDRQLNSLDRHARREMPFDSGGLKAFDEGLESARQRLRLWKVVFAVGGGLVGACIGALLGVLNAMFDHTSAI